MSLFINLSLRGSRGEFLKKNKSQQKLLKITHIYPFLRADFEYHNFTATILTFMTVKHAKDAVKLNKMKPLE